MVGESGIVKYRMYLKKGSVGKIFYLGVALLRLYYIKLDYYIFFLSFPFKTANYSMKRIKS